MWGKCRKVAPSGARWHLLRMRVSFLLSLLRRVRVLLAVVVASLVGLGTSACSGEEVPEDALNGLLRASLTNDKDALWNRLSPSSQRMLERIAAEDAVFNNGSKRPARERLLDDGLDLNVGFTKVKQVARNGDDALFVVLDHKDKEREVHVRLVDGTWRLQLPGADPANAPDPFAAARARLVR